jgi:hypothetical protein
VQKLNLAVVGVRKRFLSSYSGGELAASGIRCNSDLEGPSVCVERKVQRDRASDTLTCIRKLGNLCDLEILAEVIKIWELPYSMDL